MSTITRDERKKMVYESLVALLAQGVYPTMAAVAERSGLSPKTNSQVSTYLREFVETGLVVRLGRDAHGAAAIYLPKTLVERAKQEWQELSASTKRQ